MSAPIPERWQELHEQARLGDIGVFQSDNQNVMQLIEELAEREQLMRDYRQDHSGRDHRSCRILENEIDNRCPLCRRAEELLK